MSINVTVSGNPVKINRGKMVTADPDYAKKEFQKRRRMRLEQVRQQSKDIAENVRNKVRNEHHKQLSQVEQEGADKLKEWQTRKLLELQKQYCECLQDIGLGHSEAAIEETREEIEDAYSEILKEKGKERGHQAAKKLHNENKEKKMKQSLSTQHKKVTRDIENTRSAMVSHLKHVSSPFKKKKKKKKKSTANINISNIIDESATETENDLTMGLDISSCTCTSSPTELERGIRRRHATSPTTTDTSRGSPTSSFTKAESAEVNKIRHRKVIPEKKRTTAKSPPKPGSPKRQLRSPVKHKPEQRTTEISSSVVSTFNYPLDTRISDRIKSRRNLLSAERTCDNINCENIEKRPVLCSNSPKKLLIAKGSQTFSAPSTSTTKEVQVQVHIPNPEEVCKPCNISNQIQKQPPDHNTKQNSGNVPHYGTRQEIPVKPTVSLKNLQPKRCDKNEFNKVQYYDHPNRYTKEYVYDKSSVQKIPDESIQICPSTCSEQEFVERMFKRDEDAQKRGKKALQKVKVHKDYKELMQQLPVLQRQERIASIHSNNPIFHMSDERLKEYELKKQNRMEGAYEKLFQKTNLITLQPKNHVIEKEAFRTVDIQDSEPVLNLASWDVDSRTRDEIPTSRFDSFATSSHLISTNNKAAHLKLLLEKLKKQKDLLIREVDTLPKDSNLYKLLDELGGINGEVKEQENENVIEKPVKGKQPKVKVPSIHISSSSIEDSCTCSKTVVCHKHKLERPTIGKKTPTQKRIRHKIYSSSSSSSPSPRKKHKHRKYALILQNTSTQTTPKRMLSEFVLLQKKSENKNNEQSKQVKDHPSRYVASPISEQSCNRIECPLSPKPKPIPVSKPSSSKSDILTQKNKPSKVAEKISRSTSPGRPMSSSEKSVSSQRQTKDDGTHYKHKIIQKDRSSSPQRSKSPKEKQSQSPKKGSPKKKEYGDVRCDCNNPQEDVCEILIKIKDDEPEIVIKSPKKKKTNLLVKTDVPDTKILKEAVQVHSPVVKETIKRKVQINDEPKARSWREQFSRNSSNATSTSTSYFSPPDFSKSNVSQPQAESTKELHSHFSEILGRKHQQSNLTNTSNMSKEIDSRLVTYIKKLLSMSRGSIDDLGVSTVSDVSTPSSSLLNTEKNNPLHQLKSIMKYFNFNADDLARYLNYSDETDENTRKYNSTSTDSSFLFARNQTSGYDASKSQMTASKSQDDSKNKTSGKSSPDPQDIRQVSLEQYVEQNFPESVLKYAQMADVCHKRISNLTAMIEKVRQEKQQILSPTHSDKENSTKYLNLPSQSGSTSLDTNESNLKTTTPVKVDSDRPTTPDNLSTNSEFEQAELNRKLLEIVIPFTDTNKLKSSEISAQHKQNIKFFSSQTNRDLDCIEDIDIDILERYKLLLDDDLSKIEHTNKLFKTSTADLFKLENEIESNSQKLMKTEMTTKQDSKSSKKPFVPLLIDIPKLPKLPRTIDKTPIEKETKQKESEKWLYQEDNMAGHRKPPPAKALNAAKRFNDNITTIPHELSTILEVDSQLSTRLRRSTSPEVISKHSSPTKVFEEMRPLVVPPSSQDIIWSANFKGNQKLDKKTDNEAVNIKISDESMPDIVAELIKDDKTNSVSRTDKKEKQKREDLDKNRTDTAKHKVSPRKQVNLYNLSKILAEQSTDSSTDKSELENVEMMLKSMGMGWAVATIRKTQEALTRVSSSSSLEVSSKQLQMKTSDNSSTSDITLHNFMENKIICKSMTSSSKSDSSLSPFMREFQNISAIHGSGSSTENKHRTSTPVQTTKSSEKSKNNSHRVIFTAESDLSSVKAHSDNNFLTIPSDIATSNDSQSVDG